jgi:hypothetical protein
MKITFLEEDLKELDIFIDLVYYLKIDCQGLHRDKGEDCAQRHDLVSSIIAWTFISEARS